MASLDEIRQTFFIECEEQLEALTDGLSVLEDSDDRDEILETVNTMFRAVHSIKGGAASFSLDAITNFSHTFEFVLDDLRSDRMEMTPEVVKKFYRATDHLSDLIASGGEASNFDEKMLEDAIAEIGSLRQSSDEEAGEAGTQIEAMQLDPSALGLVPMGLGLGDAFAPPESNIVEISLSVEVDFFNAGHDPLHLIRELKNLGEVEILDQHFEIRLDNESVAVEAFNAFWQFRVETSSHVTDFEDVFSFVKDCATVEISQPLQNETATEGPVHQNKEEGQTTVTVVEKKQSKATDKKEPEAKKSSAAKTTLRVDLDLVDGLINLVGELVINQSVLAQTLSEQSAVQTSGIESALDELKTLSRQIQEGVMALRAQSVKPLFQRMARIVRETAVVADKEVRFETEGEATEVDRTVIEHLIDPLTHIIRNSIDHGLEPTEDREKCGKDRVGMVTLTASHKSGRVIIEVSDDGRGINRDKVLAKAIERGLVGVDAKLSPGEIDRLLFLPGFSTASEVTSLSGRGVGMDVVNQSIQKLGGRVSISSNPGVGTNLTISLPLTLAVLDGMVVDVSGQTMVVPISAISETIRPRHNQVHKIGPDSKMINVRDIMIPIVELSQTFGYQHDQRSGDKQQVLLLIETDGGVPCALAVDKIFDQRQVVIKSLEGNYGEVPGIAAATILGDGKIALIVDPDEVSRKVSHDSDLASMTSSSGGFIQ